MSTAGAFFNGHILSSLLILDTVQECPASRARVLLSLQMSKFGLAVDEGEHLTVGLDVIFTMAGVDFEAREDASFSPGV